MKSNKPMEPAPGDRTRHEAGKSEAQAAPASEAAPKTVSMDGTRPAGRAATETDPATEAGSEAKPSTEPEAKTSTEPGTATEAEAAREAGAAGEEAGAEPATATKPATEAGTARPRSLRERLRERLQRRRRALSRRLEYRRLRRLRKLTVPAYTHCKNCGERLQGMYCHRCGQYALDIEQPFWKYIKQYFENVYQFDSKVWQTLWLLFRRPGFLTTEFNAGKINSYVHPFRLYMFISVVFFTLFFMVASSTAEQQLRHERYRTSRLPKGVVEALRTGRGGADTCVYLYDGAGLAEMLDFNDLRSDSLLRITPLGSRHGVARVELPRMLFDSCLRVTTLAEQDRINLEGAREVLGKAAEEAAGSESGAENGDGGEAGAKAGADADVVPESGSGDGAESGHGAGITAGAGTAASAGGVPGSEAGIKTDAEDAAMDKAMASIKGVDVDEEELAVIGALLAFDPERTTVYAWQPPQSQSERLEQMSQQTLLNNLLAQLSKWTPLYMMFLLPLFALLLARAYRRCRMNYMQHFVHAIHINCFFLILLSVPAFLLIYALAPESTLSFPSGVVKGFFALVFLYMLLSSRRVYGLGWWRTLFKTVWVFVLFTLLAGLIAAGLLLWLVSSFSDGF